jgi:transcriptional regulator with XRE-family HTH domain
MNRAARKIDTMPTFTEKAFGSNLKEARLKAGLTQDGLAKKAKIKKAHVSLLEAGDRSPSMATANRLAAALKMTLAELFTAPN